MGRIIWSVAKHFNFLRNIFYKIDLNKSKNILEQLQPQLISSSNTQLIDLYKKAVSSFNLIAPKHAVKEELKTQKPKQTKPLVDVAKTISNEAQPVISQPSVVNTSKPESITTTSAPEKEASKLTLPLSKEAAELKKKISMSYQGKISEEEALKRITGRPPGTFLYFTNDQNSYSFLIYVDDQKKNIMTKLSKSNIDKEMEDFVKSAVLKSPIVLNPKKIQVLNPHQKVNVKTPLQESPTVSAETIKNKETPKPQPLSIKQQIALADHGVLPEPFAKSLLQGRDPGTFLVHTDPNSQHSEHVTISLAYVMPDGTVCNSGILQAELEKHIQAYPNLFKTPLDKSKSEIPQPTGSPATPKESPKAPPKANKGPQLNAGGSKKDPSIPTVSNPIPLSPPIAPQKSLILEEAQKIGLTGKAALAYHGTMPASEAKKLLEGQKPGSFLLFTDVINGKLSSDNAVTIYGLFSDYTINDNQVLPGEADHYLLRLYQWIFNPLQPTQQANASYNPDKYLTPEVSATVTATIGPSESKEKLKTIQIPVPKEIMEILVKQQLANVSALGLKGKAALAYQGCISDDAAGKLLSGQKPGTYCVYKVNETDSSFKIRWSTKDNFLTSKLCDNVDEVNSFCNASPSELVFPLPAHSIQNNIINILSACMQNPQTPVMLAKGLKVKESVEKGEDKDSLLVKAVQNGEIENAAWLIKQGASLGTLCKLNNKTVDEQAICDWLFKVFLPMPVTPMTLDDYALGMGYGYKAANLMILESKAAKMNESLKAAEVKVPPFLPISDFELQNYATKGCPELLNLWEEFKNSFDTQEKDKFINDPINNSLKISLKGLDILSKIQKQIVQHFANNRYLTLQIQEWLKKEKPQFIIVRSTGKEDSDTNSNAGGNASIPFIKPDALSLSIAIGKVLASYFAEKSITQRLLSGDLSLFTEKKPFMPVLLQVMIGENVGGQGSKDEDIPRSGVLFTRQEDKADGVTLIQTGLGNNEGIVTSSVPVDSYYVGDDQNIHAVVKRKTIRYVSVAKENKFNAEPIKNNNTALENSQALPDNVILDLKKVADEVSKGYGNDKETMKPMDMEYTVKLKDPSSSKPVIYLLQARPLLKVQNKSDKPNSFTNLSLLKNINQKDKVAAKTLLDGNSYVRKVESNQDIIFCSDLTSALLEYSKLDNTQTVKTIVIKKPAPSTSHEAVILRPKGVAVLVIEESATIRTSQKYGLKG